MTEKLIANFNFKFDKLPQQEELFALIDSLEGSKWQKGLKLFDCLKPALLAAPDDIFLLPVLLDLLDAFVKKHGSFHFKHFELWLNLFSGFSNEENLLVRAKIAGRNVPRTYYQRLFPIGAGKTYFGSHTVSAHKNPDLDTMVASFWGWLDAFAARVGKGLHKWNVQTKQPVLQIREVFEHLLSPHLFSLVAIAEETLQIRAEDFLEASEDLSSVKTSVELTTPLNELLELVKSHEVIACSYEGELIGVISSAKLEKAPLGTLSWRDFSNPHEGKFKGPFELLSVIDHHRVELESQIPPVAYIGDVQSCNVLLYELSQSFPQTSWKRELTECHLFLLAILDDTDFLAKMTYRDLECVVSLLNRMKTLTLGKESSVVEPFTPSEKVELYASKLLQNEEFYALYKPLFEIKERILEEDLLKTARGEESDFFADTKEQKTLARVGQAKVFVSNLKALEKSKEDILDAWLKNSKQAYNAKKELTLHILMISTIDSADALLHGASPQYVHSDEIWIWAPEEKQALEGFLERFLLSPSFKEEKPHAWCTTKSGEKLKALNALKEEEASFEKQDVVFILKVPAGKITSRKSQITPFLRA